MRLGLWKHEPGLFVSKAQRCGLFIELLDRFKRLLRRLKEPFRKDDERIKPALIKAKHERSSLRGTKQTHCRITKINSYRFKIASSAEGAFSQ